MQNLVDVPVRRCAIYTRKSTSRGLDQRVNSLVTQRELSSAYIKSQEFKGWQELPERYDDGGHSGSGLDRPALARLMHDIEAGKIDVVIVYKIDRLTRTLLDFVRLIEVFDRADIAFVSISQAFDTSDSMGRMILNVLLTFSQFERELISERMKDSIRSRRKHGKLHGGVPPFGYDRVNGNLIIDKPETKIVQFIFDEFIRTERYTKVAEAVKDAGFLSSVKYTKKGKARGGKPVEQATVYQILNSPIYVGEIHGEGKTYEGAHDPLISRETWDAAQEISQHRRVKPPDPKQTDHFLAGMLWDDTGRHMRLEIKVRRDQTYHTYVSSEEMWSRRELVRPYRCNATNLDESVLASVTALFNDRRRLRACIKKLGIFDDELSRLTRKGRRAARRLLASSGSAKKLIMSAILFRVEVGPETITLQYRVRELRRFLLWTDNIDFRGDAASWLSGDARYEDVNQVQTVASARWPALHIHPRDNSVDLIPKKGLVDLIAAARKAQRLVEQNRDGGLDAHAKQMRCGPIHFARLVRLNYLAPDIVTSILDGSQPETLTRRQLLESNLPTDWAAQRQLLGIDPPANMSAGQWNIFGRPPPSRDNA